MSFTIAHFSDAHLSPAPFPTFREMRLKRFMGYVNWVRGRARLNNMGVLDRLVADMLAHRPDHVAMTGDIVNIALAIEFKRAVAWMKRLGDPASVSFTPGNHDAYVRDAIDGLARSFAPWTRGDGVAPGAESFPYLRVRGDVAIIGLNSGVPTAPLLASGRLGPTQLAALQALLAKTGANGLARIILIHHPPLASAPQPVLRGLDDAAEFEQIVAEMGAELILHGHAHKRMLNSVSSHATRCESGRIPVVGVPAASSASRNPRMRAAYHLIKLERGGAKWRLSVRVRGLLPGGSEIGERDPMPV